MLVSIDRMLAIRRLGLHRIQMRCMSRITHVDPPTTPRPKTTLRIKQHVSPTIGSLSLPRGLSGAGSRVAEMTVELGNDSSSNKVMTTTMMAKDTTTTTAGRPFGARWRAARDNVVATFLPAGYPHSVAPGYMPYTQWTFLHSVTGTVTGVLSMQSLLYAIGLGAGSIPLAAALNWIIKDGLGQLGGVLYVSVMGEKFDAEPKRLRFLACSTMQAASLLEVLLPLVPHLFLPIASISNVGKNIAWLASSATRAQINQTYAVNDNLGDLTGKAGSQATAAGVIGTGLGVIVSAQVGTDFTSILGTFLPLSAFTLYALAQSNRAVITRTLDAQRLDLILASWRSGHGVPTPAAVAPAEKFVRPYTSPVRVNPPLAQLSTTAVGAAESLARHGFAAAPNCAWVVAGASPETVMRAYYVASMSATPKVDPAGVMLDRIQHRMHHHPHHHVWSGHDAQFHAFRAAVASAGWHVDAVFVDQEHECLHLDHTQTPTGPSQPPPPSPEK
ncbi:vitamin B6 photo-protection and homoeostasis-domain-containing protein [Blastocladiella britannica]|nr:vitamin B6 photo-protection and homoeostasis-domain-containing protein [Blastocladiella britannica]